MDFLQMEGNKKHLIIKKSIYWLSLILLIQSCLSPTSNSVQQSGSTSSNVSSTTDSSTSNSSDGPTSVTHSSTINYFQNGDFKYHHFENTDRLKKWSCNVNFEWSWLLLSVLKLNLCHSRHVSEIKVIVGEPSIIFHAEAI